jgi:hypothetical protein
MASILKSAFRIIFPAMIIGNAQPYSRPPVTIAGTVLQQKDQKPLENTYLYIIPGEEEAVTEKKGKFLITTWQSFPVTIVVEHHQYKKKQLRIHKPSNDLIIVLE